MLPAKFPKESITVRSSGISSTTVDGLGSEQALGLKIGRLTCVLSKLRRLLPCLRPRWTTPGVVSKNLLFIFPKLEGRGRAGKGVGSSQATLAQAATSEEGEEQSEGQTPDVPKPHV